MKLLAVLIIVLMLLGSFAVLSPVHAVTGTMSNHIVFIMLENNPLSDVTASSAPYMHTLASSRANSTNYVGSVSSSWSPSLPNYIGITSGSTQGITDDNGPSSHPLSVTNIVDRFESAGVIWKAYMEGMSATNICNGGGSSDGGTSYIVHHNPFAYYTDITGSSTRCAKVVPAGSYAGATSCTHTTPSTVASTLISDLGTISTAPQFAWITPNNIDNAHNCGAPSTGSVASPNEWLSVLVPLILGTTTFTSDSTATIIITFDEPSTGTYGTNPVYLAIAGPGSKTHFTSSTKYTHLNLLATEESNFGLSCIVTGGDCGQTVMSEFFGTSSPPPPPQHCTVGEYRLVNDQWNVSTAAPSTATVDSANVFHSKLINTGSSFTGSFYTITQQGGAPGPIPTGPNIPLPGGALYSTQVIYNNRSFVNPTTPSDQIEIYIGLYFWFSQPKTTPLGTAQLLDSQARISSNQNGADFLVGHNFTNFLTNQNRFTYREVISTLQPGQNITILNFNVTSYYARALARLGIANVGAMNLTRVETGVEGYGVNYVNTEWCFALRGSWNEAFLYNWADGVNHDGEITILDTSAVAAQFSNSCIGEPQWNASTPVSCYWDYTQNGIVDINDYSIVTARYGQKPISNVQIGAGQPQYKLDQIWHTRIGLTNSQTQTYYTFYLTGNS